ncbi:MAG: hypothetical protein AAB580_04570 [Patescibacteria group bacterium]
MLPNLGTVEQCDPMFLGNSQKDEEAKSRLIELTGKENPTPRELYQASCEEWRSFGVKR